MNRECNGDHFVADGKRYYYCLLDGAIMRANKLLNGDKCPNCNRTIDANLEPYQAETRITIQVRVPESKILNDWTDI